MSENSLAFLLSVIKLFEESVLPVWVFGGWAEELWQIAKPRQHNDIDLLYPAASFDALDHLIAQTNRFQEIQSKRFSHKRAIIYGQVMIEFLLVRSANGSYFTDFFSGQYHLEWPDDLFCHRVNVSGYSIKIASKQALVIYRQCHQQVEKAYQDFQQPAMVTGQELIVTDEEGRMTANSSR